ncbi:hypothetical protein FOA52_003353 [Chlamydomonas sp. UWO 241]|nr:hypothetical protein FOA52_003353 [Chlamydomonas sp. UWO 241]
MGGLLSSLSLVPRTGGAAWLPPGISVHPTDDVGGDHLVLKCAPPIAHPEWARWMEGFVTEAAWQVFRITVTMALDPHDDPLQPLAWTIGPLPPDHSQARPATGSHGLRLSPSQMTSTFPFHFVLDNEQQVLQVGAGLLRAVPQLATPRLHVSQVFELVHPAGATWDACGSDTGTPVVLRCRRGLLLIGELLRTASAARGDAADAADASPAVPAAASATGRGDGSRNGGGAAVTTFLGSPCVDSLAELQAHGLALSDFAAHDPTPSLIVLVEEQMNAEAAEGARPAWGRGSHPGDLAAAPMTTTEARARAVSIARVGSGRRCSATAAALFLMDRLLAGEEVLPADLAFARASLAAAAVQRQHAVSLQQQGALTAQYGGGSYGPLIGQLGGSSEVQRSMALLLMGSRSARTSYASSASAPPSPNSRANSILFSSPFDLASSSSMASAPSLSLATSKSLGSEGLVRSRIGLSPTHVSCPNVISEDPPHGPRWPPTRRPSLGSIPNQGSSRSEGLRTGRVWPVGPQTTKHAMPPRSYSLLGDWAPGSSHTTTSASVLGTIDSVTDTSSPRHSPRHSPRVSWTAMDNTGSLDGSVQLLRWGMMMDITACVTPAMM